MTFTCRNVQVTFHPLMAAVFAVNLFIGRLLPCACTLIALFMHECGHLFVAKRLRLRLVAFELTPFGGVMEISGSEALPSGKAAALSLAGPLMNALGALIAARGYALSLFSFPFARAMLRAQLALFLINLLPVLPLDGGRAAQALLRKRLREDVARNVLTSLGVLFGALLACLSVLYALRGELVFAPAFWGLYLIYLTSLERRKAVTRYVSSLIGRRGKLDTRDVLTVECLAAHEKTPVRALLGRLSLHKYHVVTVLGDDGLMSLGRIEEGALCEGMLEDGGVTLGDLVSRQIGQS